MRGTAHLAMRRIILFVLAALLFGGVLELAVRVDDLLTWRAPLWGPYSRELLTVADEHGVRGRPGAQYEKWKLNGFGFRGPEIQKQKAPGVTRVMVVGASETFGLYEAQGHEYVALLREALDAASPGRFEVINAAIAGMSPPRLAEYFDNWLQQFEPDVIVFYPTPHFYLEEAQPAASATLKPSPEPRMSLRILPKARNVYKRLLPGWVQSRVNVARIAAAVSANSPDWVWSDVPPDRVALFESQLADLVKRFLASGSRVMLCTHASAVQPSPTGLDRKQLLALRIFYPKASERALRGIDPALNAVVRRTANRFDLPVIDVDAGLARVPRYFADFSHFTDEGAQAVAALMARDILADVASRADSRRREGSGTGAPK
jgi:hypothetical protein